MRATQLQLKWNIRVFSILLILFFLSSCFFQNRSQASVRAGLQLGGSRTVFLPDQVDGGWGGLAGFHLIFYVNQSIRVRTYLELQKFSVSPGTTLLAGDSDTSMVTGLALLSYQLPTGDTGAMYIGVGWGMGLGFPPRNSLTWLTAALGSEFNRDLFIEARVQFESDDELFRPGYFSLVLGYHFNSKPGNWKDSYIYR